MSQNKRSELIAEKNRFGGLLGNAVLLILFLLFSFFGRVQVNAPQSGLLKELVGWLTCGDMLCVSQFVIDELGRVYLAVRAMFVVLTLCLSFFTVMFFAITVFWEKRRFVAEGRQACRHRPALRSAGIFTSVFSFCLKYKE